MKTTTLALIASTCFLAGGIICFINVVVNNDWGSLFFGVVNCVLCTMSMKVAIDDKD